MDPSSEYSMAMPAPNEAKTYIWADTGTVLKPRLTWICERLVP